MLIACTPYVADWQFVVWGRQLVLTILTITPEFVGSVDTQDDDRQAPLPTHHLEHMLLYAATCRHMPSHAVTRRHT